jgi:hypothetical protein
VGDYAWTKVTCRPEHRAAFEAVGFDDDSEAADVSGAIALANSEANYAADSDFRDIAAKGIPFHAVHDAGGEYSAGRYASDGLRLVHVDTIDAGGFPAVEVDEGGEPNQDQLHLVHDYYQVLAAAKKAIVEGLPPGRRWQSADEILKAMDPGLFREQRRRLGQLVEDARRSITGPISAADVDLLDGLEAMLDDLADFSHDVLGLDCLLDDRHGG